MKLFFETQAQGVLFLVMVPAGFILGLLLQLAGKAATTRPVWDVLIMFLCFGFLGFAVVMLEDTGLRLYHLLALVTGALLYLLGVGRLFRMLGKNTAETRKKMENQAGKHTQTSKYN